MKLTDSVIKSFKPSDSLQKKSDGNALYLYVTPTGAKYWRYAYRWQGKQQTLSLGVYPEVSLKEARAERDRMAELLKQGINPSTDRKEAKLKQASAIRNDFKSVALAWWEQWKVRQSEGHAKAVWRRIDKDIFPVMGDYPVKGVSTSLVILAVKTISDRGAYDVAKRAYQNINMIMRYARTHELIEINPAADLTLEHIIPPVKTKNQTRIDGKDLPQLLRDVDAYDGLIVTKYAIQLLALTFVRTKELIGATWSEIDFKGRVWRIAGERMKMQTPHIVPLSDQAITILTKLKAITGGGEHLFPSVKGDGKTMSNNTILYALYRMGYHSRMTGHGFRGVASTALREQGFSRDLVELQLAHLVGSDVERAYNSMELLLDRTIMMQRWADYLDEERRKGIERPTLKVV